MNATTTGSRLTDEQLAFWNAEGYLIVRGLFTAAEVAEIGQFFNAIGDAGKPIEGFWAPETSATNDPLKRYPRIMQPHRWDQTGLAKRYLLAGRIHEILTAFYQEEPVATQSMFYFKPPGARGQALHQDNLYLQIRPGTCVAAWTAIDPATTENGGLYIVPGTQAMEIVCPEVAEESESFTTHLVKPPKGKKAIPVNLQPGDTLFFNGSIVHGSPPNRSKTMWRRSFICHYMPKSSTHISHWYAQLLDFAGNEVHYDQSPEGGPCGREFPTQWH